MANTPPPPANADTMVAEKTFIMSVLFLSSFVVGVLPVILVLWCRKVSSATISAATADMTIPSAILSSHSHLHLAHQHTNTFGSRVVSLLLCFGGGVLLFTTLLHLQPEVRDGVKRLQESGTLPTGQGTEHLGDIIFCIGFFLVFLVDEFMHSAVDRFLASHATRRSAGDVLHRSMSLRRRTLSNTSSSYAVNESPTRHGRLSCGEDTAEEQIDLQGGEDFLRNHGKNSLHCLLTVIALSFHEVFEGMAIGLERIAENMWYLSTAVATHKLVIAFCIGLELTYSNTRRSVLVVYMAMFAVVTPLGIAAGLILAQFESGSPSKTSGPVAVVLQGLTAGTLLYVVFFEVLARHKQPGFSHVFAIMFGFGILLVLQILSEYTIILNILLTSMIFVFFSRVFRAFFTVSFVILSWIR